MVNHLVSLLSESTAEMEREAAPRPDRSADNSRPPARQADWQRPRHARQQQVARNRRRGQNGQRHNGRRGASGDDFPTNHDRRKQFENANNQQFWRTAGLHFYLVREKPDTCMCCFKQHAGGYKACRSKPVDAAANITADYTAWLASREQH